MVTLGKKSDTRMIDQAPKTRNWQIATLERAEQAAANVKTLVFRVPVWVPHQAGQHYDIRLTAPNGYQAERSYSLANPPEEEGVLSFGVELLENGEVSPYLWNLPLGGQVEVRGPIGGHFIWNVGMPGPLVLIAGGSGMVPLVAMLRHHEKHISDDAGRDIVFIISVRKVEYLLYKEELEKLSQRDPHLRVVVTVTDGAPDDWLGYRGRISEEMFTKELNFVKDQMPLTYVCGPTGFVEAATKLLIGIGYNPHQIKTERFGGA
jgi:ferredoxin-NADP reductase